MTPVLNLCLYTLIKMLPDYQSPGWTTWKRKEPPTVEISATLSQPPGRQWMQAQHLMFNARKILLKCYFRNGSCKWKWYEERAGEVLILELKIKWFWRMWHYTIHKFSASVPSFNEFKHCFICRDPAMQSIYMWNAAMLRTSLTKTISIIIFL